MRKINTNRETNKSDLQLSEKNFWIVVTFFMLVVICFCFYNLGKLPVSDWDEARHGVSAYEMIKNKNYIVNTYAYETDYWNLKPPLSFWGVILGYSIFGLNVFGMRFYSALAFILTVIIIVAFCKKRYGNLEAAIILILLASCAPFYRFHFARNADADALFSLFSVISILAMLRMKEKPWMASVCSFTFALAFLTKSWHSLFIVAIVGIYMIWQKMFKSMSIRWWMAFIASATVPILIWIILRWQYDGFEFFKQMVQVDLLNRSTQVLESHDGSIFFYISSIIRGSLSTGLLPLFSIFIYYSGYINNETKEHVILPKSEHFSTDRAVYLLWISVPLISFSIVSTKLFWYVMPTYFPILILSGVVISQMLRSTNKEVRALKFIVVAVTGLIVISGFVQVYHDVKPHYSDPLQDLIYSESDTLAATYGKNVYLAMDLNHLYNAGSQSHTLIGELYHDWHCKESTDIQMFLNDEQAQVIVLDAYKYYENTQLFDSRCEVLVNQNGYAILEKN